MTAVLYGYAFVSAPATDLVTVQTSPIAFDPSPAEVYDIQAQGSELRASPAVVPRPGNSEVRGTRTYPQSPLQVRCCCGLGGTVGVPAAVRSP
jgi:hypothetical protein